MIIPLLSSISFFIGVLLAGFTDWSVSNFVWIAIGFLFFKKRKVAILILAFLFGLLRMQVYEDSLTADFEEGWVELSGSIVEEIDLRADQQNITIETEQGRVLVSTSIYKELQFGEWVKVSGFLERPDQGSYERYLFRYGILYTMDKAQLEVLQPPSFSLRGSLYELKNIFQDRINKLYFEPEASLVSGLLLGSRKGMSEELTRDFQATGLTHIVAVSGYNISLVIACIFSLFGFLPLKKRVVLSIFMVSVFVLFVGASSAAVRAGIMGSLGMWGLYSGRRCQAFFVLLWSALLMALWNPAIFIFDIGFQLSFASTLGLLAFVPIFQKHFPSKGFLVESLLLTLSAQLATFPFIVFYFGRLSLISPLANILVAPFLPFAMFFSALSLIGGEFALLGAVYIKSVIKIVELLSALPFADTEWTLNVQGFSFTLFLLFFSVLLFYKSKWARAFGLNREAPSSMASDLSSQRHSTPPEFLV